MSNQLTPKRATFTKTSAEDLSLPPQGSSTLPREHLPQAARGATNMKSNNVTDTNTKNDLEHNLHDRRIAVTTIGADAQKIGASINRRRRILPRNFYALSWLILLCVASVLTTYAQSLPYSNNKADQTLRSNGRVNPSTLGLEMNIPLASYPGRGGSSVPVALSYSSKVWRMQNNGLQPRVNNPTCFSLLQAKYGEYSASGWTSSLGLTYIEYIGEDNLYGEDGLPLSDAAGDCGGAEQSERNYVKRVIAHLPNGEAHELRASDEPVHRSRSGNVNVDMTGTYYSVDSSKMKFIDDGNGTYRLYLPDGSYYDFASTKTGLDQIYVRMGTLFRDVNGNQLTFNAADANNPNGSWTDSIGRTIPVPVSPTAAPSAATVQNYQLPGITNPYKFYWKQLKGASAAESGLTDFNQSLRYTGSYAGYNQPGHGNSEILFQGAQNAQVFSGSDPVFNPIVLTAVEMPNGLKYQFSYNIYGEIEKIIYPTGGEEHLTIGQVEPVDPITADNLNDIPYRQANRGVTQRQVYENASATPSTWTYATGTEGSYFKTIIGSPDGTRMERLLIHSDPCTGCQAGDYGFGFVLSGMPVEERMISSTNQLMSKKLTTWTKTEHAVNGGNKNAEWHPRMTKEEAVIYDASNNALSSTITYDYAGDLNANENPINVSATKQYGFTASIGSLGSLEKSVETDYLSNSTYDAANLKSLPTVSRIKDAAGNIAEQSQIEYDEAGYGNGMRGQATTSRTWTDLVNNQYIETHAKYDTYGNVIQATDAKGNVTTTEYSATYNFAYPTKVTTPAPDPTGQSGSSTSFETSMIYDLTTGLMLSKTDANGQVSTMEYNDPLLRPTKFTPPSAGGQTVMEYTDIPGAVAVKTKMQIDTANWAESTIYADGLGRTIKSEKKDNAGNVFIDSEYDNMGHVKRVTNPYRIGDTKLWTENTFDDLERVTKVKSPDAAEVNTNYDLSISGTLGTVVTITDQAGKLRRNLTNSLGQLVRVDEPDDSGNLGSVASPNQSTNYSYDLLGKMVKVTQGVQSRYFKYDNAGRLLRVRQPEQEVNSSLALSDAATGNSDWSAGFTYDANGNILTATDTKGIVTTSAYDNLNRVISRSYSDSTPVVSYKYDDSAIQYAKGKLTRLSNSVSTSQITSLDNLGRVLSNRQTTDGNNYDSSYLYNLAGNLLEETYPSGRKIKNTVASDASLSKVETQALNGTYQTRADNFSYTAAGGVSSMMLGNSRWENAQFNSRLQPTQLGLGTTATDTSLWKVNYDYGTSDNNGNIKSQTINVPSINPLIQNYTYDSLNRIKSATETANGSQTWKQAFNYDRYGNRNFDSANTTTLGNCATNQCNPTIDVNTNRFIASQGYTYDSAGNIIVDAQGRQFTFNGDNKQMQVKDAANNVIGSYYYDGEGKRIKKVTSEETTTFVYSGTKLIAEYSVSTATPTSPTTQYVTTDTLGTPRVMTDGSGNVFARRDFMPFGEEISNLGGRSASVGYNQDTIRQKFTGYQRDKETNLDFAEARYYSNVNGRFTAVDPLLASGKSANPQSFNRYAYVLNNPIRGVDPTGMYPVYYHQFADGSRQYSSQKNDFFNERYHGPAIDFVSVANNTTRNYRYHVTSTGIQRGAYVGPTFSGSQPSPAAAEVSGTSRQLINAIADQTARKATVVGYAEGGAVLAGITGGAALTALPATVTTLSITGAEYAATHPQEMDETVETATVKLSQVADGFTRIYRGTGAPNVTQVGEIYRSNPAAAPSGAEEFLTTQEAILHTGAGHPEAVSATQDLGTALTYPTSSSGSVIVYDIPNTLANRLPSGGNLIQGEMIFKGSIPDIYKVATLPK